MSSDQLLSRIRGEYQEMPGLRLTVAQASRLWHIDPVSCQTLLDRLVAEDYLHRTRDGAYVAFPRSVAAKADAHSSSIRRKPHAS